jgi:hypothetical protein
MVGNGGKTAEGETVNEITARINAINAELAFLSVAHAITAGRFKYTKDHIRIPVPVGKDLSEYMQELS